MALLLSMLPFYLMGNFHCIGMCGPLVVFIGSHRFRYAYFAGRLLSFSLAGLLAGETGSLLQGVVHQTVMMSFAFGAIFCFVGISYWTGWQIPQVVAMPACVRRIHQRLSLLMLQDKSWALFLFGFSTVFLPCGQSLLVFSACALTGDALTGLLNGAVFALLTSPALWIAMHAGRLFKDANAYYNRLIGGAALLAGTLALLRGCADMGWVPHLVLSERLHVMLF